MLRRCELLVVGEAIAIGSTLHLIVVVLSQGRIIVGVNKVGRLNTLLGLLVHWGKTIACPTVHVDGLQNGTLSLTDRSGIKLRH